MIEKIAAHLRLHLYADYVTVILDEITKQHSDNVQNKHDDTRNDDSLIFLIGYVVVKHIVGHDRIYHTDDRNEKRRKHIKRKHFLVGLVIADKSF
jgi:hypothetical protein